MHVSVSGEPNICLFIFIINLTESGSLTVFWFDSEMECPAGQVYEACGSVCDRTCRALSGAESGCSGEKLCEEGCFCPAGKYLSDTRVCVSADLCTCLHDGQLYQPSDVYADQNSIWLVTVHLVAVLLTKQKRCCVLKLVRFFCFLFFFFLYVATVRMAPCAAAPLK